MTIGTMRLGFLLLLMGMAWRSEGGVLATREAEACTITCVQGPVMLPDPFASGGVSVGHWGGAVGDCIEWNIDLKHPVPDLSLGVRYAYHHAEYVRRVPTTAVPHALELYIDGTGPVPVPVGDTGGWNHFATQIIALPALEAGVHTFWLMSPAPDTAANIDSMTFYSGPLDSEAPGPWRPTRLARSRTDRFVICATPLARLDWKTSDVAGAFDQLSGMMQTHYGQPARDQLFVHFLEAAAWGNPGIPASRNQHGIYLFADKAGATRSDWCWTLAEGFGDRAVPEWFRHSSARVSGLLEWLPALDSSTTASEDVRGAALLEKARTFLADEESSCGEVEVVHTAMRLRFGDEVFPKFWGLVNERRAATLKDGSRLQPLDKYTVLQLLSDAAGQDVTPWYRRWKGFAEEGPVDPLIVTETLLSSPAAGVRR